MTRLWAVLCSLSSRRLRRRQQRAAPTLCAMVSRTVAVGSRRVRGAPPLPLPAAATGPRAVVCPSADLCLSSFTALTQGGSLRRPPYPFSLRDYGGGKRGLRHRWGWSGLSKSWQTVGGGGHRCVWGGGGMFKVEEVETLKVLFSSNGRRSSHCAPGAPQNFFRVCHTMSSQNWRCATIPLPLAV